MSSRLNPVNRDVNSINIRDTKYYEHSYAGKKEGTCLLHANWFENDCLGILRVCVAGAWRKSLFTAVVSCKTV